MENQTPLLKIFTGAYAGSELSLTQSEYVLGKSLDCDIAVDDLSLAERHCILRLAEQSYFLEILDTSQPVLVNGIPVEESPIEVHFFDQIDIGSFIFSLGFSGQPWPEIQNYAHLAEIAAAAEELETENNDEINASATSTSESEAGTQDGVGMAGGDAQQEIDAEEILSAQSQENHEQLNEAISDATSENLDTPPKFWQKWLPKIAISRKHKRIITAGLCIVIMVGIGLFTFVHFSDQDIVSIVADQSSTKNVPVKNPMDYSVAAETIQKSSNPMPFSNQPITQHVHIVTDSNQVTRDLIVKSKDNGKSLDSASNYKAAGLKEALGGKVKHPMLAEEAITAEQNNSEMETATEALQALLDAFKLRNLKMVTGSDSESVIVQGYVDQLGDWLKVKARIKRDIKSIKLIDRVEHPLYRKKRLLDLIDERGLAQEINVFWTNKGLVAKTSISEDMEFVWQEIESEYKQRFDNTPKLYRIRETKPWLDIKSVSFGFEPYIVMKDGSKYIVGSQVLNGYTLEKIDYDRIVLKGDEGVKSFVFP